MVLSIAMTLVATSIFVSKKVFLKFKVCIETITNVFMTDDSEYENRVLIELEAQRKRETES